MWSNEEQCHCLVVFFAFFNDHYATQSPACYRKNPRIFCDAAMSEIPTMIRNVATM